MIRKKYYYLKKRDNQLGAKVYPILYKCNIPALQEIENYYFLLEKFNDYKDRVSYLTIEKEMREKLEEKWRKQLQE